MRYWKKLNLDNTIKSVESYSHNLPVAGATEIDQTEFEDYIASLPPPPLPIDWKALWLAADTVAKKISVLAKKLELE